ncbi:MAG: hypothetical protein HPY53_14475 [Brevinematales bacterium]|nr:hypothetical protein [Brevinematales bacterium]
MIRQSFYKWALREVKEEYGGGILEMPDQSAVLLKNFKVPEGYSCGKTYLFFEIPPGFGFGMNIMNTWVLLKHTDAKYHLIPETSNVKTIHAYLDKLSVKMPKDYEKQWGWFWVCFHAAEDAPGGIRLPESDGSAEGENDALFGNYIGFREHIRQVYLALHRIIIGDPDMLNQLYAMYLGREAIIERQKQEMDAFQFSHNWRNMKWVWD